MSLPLNIIKSDKSLIDMASNFEHGKEIISGSASMVQRMGIHYIQGYYFSRPLPEKQFIQYVQSEN